MAGIARPKSLAQSAVLWGGESEVEELPTIPFRAIRRFGKGRVSQNHAPSGRPAALLLQVAGPRRSLDRLRYWPTRRRVLRIRGEYNPKTAPREDHRRQAADLVDAGAACALLAPLFTPLRSRTRC